MLTVLFNSSLCHTQFGWVLISNITAENSCGNISFIHQMILLRRCF